ncbi:MAG TPA: PAS domain S-box protein, partial [Caldilineaceae bacterium]|nr:PAS domain S-box protein [Caldilineaceae bacterium]
MPKGVPQPARDLLARLPIPLAITRMSDGVILFANAELGRLHRAKVSQLIGRPIQELYMNLEDRQQLLDLLARDGKVREFDLQTRRFGDGAPLWVSISVAPIHFEGEAALCAAVVDITARKQAEQALRESEAQFRLLAENAQDLIFRYELLPYPHLSYVSPSATRLTGYKPEELYGDPALAAMLAAPGVLQRTDQGAQPGQGLARPVELSLRRKDGSTVWFELRNVPIYDGQGKLAAFQGIARDITERKQADERLRMYSRAMEQSPASILITNTHGDIEYVNPKFCQVTGYTPEEVKGKNPRILKSGRTSH